MKATIHLKSFPGHKGVPGQRGGSAPKGAPPASQFVVPESTDKHGPIFDHANLPEDTDDRRVSLQLLDRGWEARSEISNDKTVIFTKPSKVGGTKIHMRYNPAFKGVAGGPWTVDVAGHGITGLNKRFNSGYNAMVYANKLVNDKHFFD